MDNQDKHDIIAKLNEHNAALHDDCFLDYPDGRRIFREDLHKYKIDMLVKDLWTRMQAAEHKLTDVCKPRLVEQVEQVVQKLPKHQIAFYAAVVGHFIWDVIKHVH